MIVYLLKRLGAAAAILLVICALTFTIFYIAPDDPAQKACGKACTPERIEQIRDQLGLDTPIPEQFASYVRGIFAGRTYGTGSTAVECPFPCLGFSFQTNVPVQELLVSRLPVSASIAVGAAVLWLLVGVGAGVLAALRKGSWWDRTAMGAALGGISLPIYLTALVLQYLLVVVFEVLPYPRAVGLLEDPAGWFASMLMPWIALAALYAGMYARLTRTELIGVLSQNFVRTARAKGLPERTVVRRHALRPTLTPDRDRLRHGPRRAARWRADHRVGVRPARCGQAGRRRDQQLGPAGDPRRDAVRRGLHRLRERGRGPALRGARPADQAGGLMTLLDVKDLRVSFGETRAVDGLSFSLERGRVLGLVGESGCGKSVTSLAVMGLLNGATTSGEIWFDGQELLGSDRRAVRRLRGDRLAMIFQDPLSSLNPYYPVGFQIAEAYRAHRRTSRKQARAIVVRMLDRVGIPEAERRARDYPHQFSGGMRQRVMIAMALCLEPELIIADEPTTALDVTVQAQILALLDTLRAEYGTAVLLITHDLGVVAGTADEVVVMYGGRAVERGEVHALFEDPREPYTRRLLAAVPRIDRPVPDRLETL
ncbi:ATP-binding cassette domain-containing protein [Nonomuraea dietziae]